MLVPADFPYTSGNITRHSKQYCQAVTTQDLRLSLTMEMNARGRV